MGQRSLVWVNLCLNPSVDSWLGSFRQINGPLAHFPPRFHVRIGDWCAFAARAGIVPGPGGIHYSDPAYRQRALFYAAALGDAASAGGRPGLR